MMLVDAPEASRRRLAALDAEIRRGFAGATADRRLLEGLEFARFLADESDLAGAVARFASACREAGLDVGAGQPRAIGRAVASRPRDVRVSIVEALDSWAIATRGPLSGADGAGADWRLPLGRPAPPTPTPGAAASATRWSVATYRHWSGWPPPTTSSIGRRKA